MTLQNIEQKLKDYLNSPSAKLVACVLAFAFIFGLTLTDRRPPVIVDAVSAELRPVAYAEPVQGVLLDKFEEVTEIAPTQAPGHPEQPGNTYESGSCTWGVKSWKPDVPNSWGNAKTWGPRAKADGWTVSDKPVVGAIAWSNRGEYGHVALVTAVLDGQVEIKEMNYNWTRFATRVTTVATGSYRYIY